MNFPYPYMTVYNSVFMKEIDYFVYNNVPLLEFKFEPRNGVIDKIGRNVANLVEILSNHVSLGYGGCILHGL